MRTGSLTVFASMMAVVTVTAAVAVAALTVQTAPASPASVSSSPAALMRAATEAARWIDSAAVRSERGVVWLADPTDKTTTLTNLYTGSTGVVLYYLELHHATGERAYLDSARAGADYLLAGLKEEKTTGLYTGLAGIGFTLGEVARATKDRKYQDGARQVVDLLAARAVKTDGGGVEWNDTSDIIAGGAGTGLFLLHAAEAFGWTDARDLAARAGTRLIALGKPSDGGTKWAMTPSFPRLMPNFSHGTAGIAYFLASLYKATKQQEFLTAALSGAKYLQAIAKTEGDICLIVHHEPDSGDLHYLSWCHGPAGTARLFYRLAEVTGDKAWMTWVHASARAILTSGIPDRQTPGFWNNVSACCGSAGVAEFFYDLHKATGNADYLAFARRMTDQLMSKATTDATGTRWVQAEHRVKPELLVAQTGYMQGAAGIGTLLLRARAAEQKKPTAFRLPDCPFPR
jgi:lantibiotic modifying enzyme